jgi:Alpha amylase, catalytic domain
MGDMMAELPQEPIIYEINTWVWLGELGRRYGRELTLATVPANEWDAVAEHGAEVVWLMGVWERSPAGRKISLEIPALLAEYRKNLPDFRPEDVSGSPYCIRDYSVDAHLGGRFALAAARSELARRGLGLLLDYVPNHVAPDHRWVSTHPEYFIHAVGEDDARNHDAFFVTEHGLIAHGRDPYFPPWTDTAQLNAFSPGLRKAAIDTLDGIAEQCDGVRCDMAMLLLNDVFAKTWAQRAGEPPSTEYWSDVLTAVRTRHPGFVFIAEAYWDLEWRLQQLGFDYCYDKRLYDRLLHGNTEAVRGHLSADIDYQRRLLRFLENHDEARAAAVFSPEKERAAAVVTMTLPGATLVHEGQFEGNRVKLSVHLGRRPQEPVNESLRDFYRRLVSSVRETQLKQGSWRLLDQEGWPDNQSFRNLLSWAWILEHSVYVIVVNVSSESAQARVQLHWPELQGYEWQLDDHLSGIQYPSRDGDEMFQRGLFVDLSPWAFHFFALHRSGALVA